MRKTLALAHRGFSASCPENTMAAFEAAIAVEGCHGFESDVHLSSDNEPVIIHDPVLTRTTSGTGWVKDHTFRQLRELDCGSWKGKEFAGQRMLHLDELLDLILEHDLILNLEVKNYEVFYQGIEEIIIRRIVDKKATDRVFLSSFNHVSMELCKDVLPEIKTGFLYGYPMLNAAGYARKYRTDALHPQYHCLWYQPELVEEARQVELKVHTWTANTPKDIQMCLDRKVDSIISNHPDLLVKMIREKEAGN